MATVRFNVEENLTTLALNPATAAFLTKGSDFSVRTVTRIFNFDDLGDDPGQTGSDGGAVVCCFQGVKIQEVISFQLIRHRGEYNGINFFRIMNNVYPNDDTDNYMDISYGVYNGDSIRGQGNSILYIKELTADGNQRIGAGDFLVATVLLGSAESLY